MFARLERYLYALIAMLALWAVVVAVTPAMAQAQQTAPTKDTKDTNRNTAERLVVVSPGDSLWSISSERLGPNATLRQVATGAERIYALNQNQIGGDPNLIFVGQKLSLPPVSRPSRVKESESAEASTRGPDREKALKASTTPRNTEAKPVALPDMPPQQSTPKVGLPTATDTPSPVESFVRSARSLLSSATSTLVGLLPQYDRFGERKLLGLGIIALTLLIAGLIAWRMPLKRNVGGFEAWGIPRGYVGHYPRGYVGHYRPVAKPDSGSIGDEAPAVENDLNGSAAMILAARRRRERVLREREHGSRRSLHKGLATGAHGPQVTRHLRRALTSAPGRTVAGRTVARSPRLRRRSLYQKGGRL